MNEGAHQHILLRSALRVPTIVCVYASLIGCDGELHMFPYCPYADLDLHSGFGLVSQCTASGREKIPHPIDITVRGA